MSTFAGAALWSRAEAHLMQFIPVAVLRAASIVAEGNCLVTRGEVEQAIQEIATSRRSLARCSRCILSTSCWT